MKAKLLTTKKTKKNKKKERRRGGVKRSVLNSLHLVPPHPASLLKRRRLRTLLPRISFFPFKKKKNKRLLPGCLPTHPNFPPRLAPRCSFSPLFAALNTFSTPPFVRRLFFLLMRKMRFCEETKREDGEREVFCTSKVNVRALGHEMPPPPFSPPHTLFLLLNNIFSLHMQG